jgi:hypothetical protein
MFDRIADWLLAIPDSVPILLGADPHNAALVRALAALLLIGLAIYTIAFWPFGSIIGRLFGRRSKNRQD